MTSKLKNLALICLPSLVVTGLVFLACLPQITTSEREQRIKDQKEYVKNVLQPYQELVRWAQTNNVVEGKYSQVYDSHITKFLAKRF